MRTPRALVTGILEVRAGPVMATGVRRILDNAAHRAADNLHTAERDPIRAAQWCATTAVACALLWIGQRRR